MRSIALPRSAAAAALLATFALASAQTVDGKPQVKKEILDRVTYLLSSMAYVPGMDFTKWNEFRKAEQTGLDEAKNDEEFARDVNRTLAKFNASHIVLSTPRMATMRTSGSTVGVGITIQPVEGGIQVVRTVKNAPAARGGIEPGDVIVTVEGKPTNGTAGIPGPAGTAVRLGVRKGGTGEPKDVVLIRQPFSTKREEELEFINRDTAKLTVYTFDYGYDSDRVESLMKRAAKAKTIVLDLRDNGGGAVFNLQHLMGLLMPADQSLGTFVGKRMVTEYVKATKDETPEAAEVAAWSPSKLKPSRTSSVKPFEGRLVVLVNGGSGSASEIAAAALKEQRGATVIGTKSAGAVLVSVIVSATNGFTLQYPLSDYVTPKGLRLEGNGVKPDIEATEPRFRLPKEPDPVVDKVKEYLASFAKKG